MKSHLAINVIILCILFMLSGCSLFKINQEIEEIDAAVSISGNIKHTSISDTPIVVGLFLPLKNNKHKLEQSTVVYGNSAFKFLIPAGNYYLAAFEDVNQDFNLQANESAAWYGKPSLLKAKSGKAINNISLQLKPPAQVIKVLPFIYENAKEQPLTLENDKNLGRRIKLSSPLLSPEIGKMGMWRPLEFVREQKHGIFFLQEFDANKMPVLFVHGIGGTGRVLKTLIPNLDTKRFQPWILQYPSGLRLDLIAANTSSDINKLRSKYGFDKFVVITHSMGGLVSRSIIQRQLQQQRDIEIPLFVSISTPWNGHKAAVFGVKSAPIKLPVWFDIVPGSPYLKTLRQQISDSNLNHHLFFSYKGNLSLINSENNDGTVDLSSQLLPIVQTKAKEVYGFNDSHVGVLENQELLNKVNGLLSAISL